MSLLRKTIGSASLFALVAGAAPALAQDKRPENLVPAGPAKATRPLAQAAPQQQQTVDQAFGDIAAQSKAVVQPLPVLVRDWRAEDVRKLLAFIPTVKAEGLNPSDYRAADLSALLDARGESPEVSALASKTFIWLAEDLRDGRTPMEARRQWFVVDPDADRMPSDRLLEAAVTSGDIAGTLTALDPVHPDYARLREALAKATDPALRKLIRANMDRWRWLGQDLGNKYLITNVPEYQLRLTVNDKIIKNYKVVVGKPGRTATPQLAEMVEAVIFNPTWTVPQSIVKGEGLGAKVLGNPGWAKAAGYKGWKNENGMITVVQQPGPQNSLGLMKLDMPNEHAIFLHDTPARSLFAQEARALSHGCIRVEGARQLAMTMSMLGNAKSKADLPVIQQEVSTITASGEYTRYPMVNQWPVYITYFTMATDVNGQMRSFKDIYGRDASVLAALDAPRQENRARETSEEAVEIVDDLQTS